ncbi:MAG: LytR/AlgR family response regulator transcription factor [Salibacteraceae bacterium]
MISLAIIEDEAKTRKFLRSIIEEEFKEFRVVGEAESVETGLKLLQQQQPEVLLLDVEMPDGTGFDLLNELESNLPHVIFVTAYGHYAVEAIRAGAIDYIEKPIDPRILGEGLQRIRQRIHAKEDLADSNLKAVVNSLSAKKIAIPLRTGVVSVEVQHVLYIKADGPYSEIYLEDQIDRPLVISKTLKSIYPNLQSLGFIRPHRSYLVNLSKIIGLSRAGGGDVLLSGGIEIPFSDQYKDEALKTIKLAITFI